MSFGGIYSCCSSTLQKVAYPDVGPVMLLSEASVGDLNGKLQKDVTVERFRPNIVVSDCNAFEEVLFNFNYLTMRCIFSFTFNFYECEINNSMQII